MAETKGTGNQIICSDPDLRKAYEDELEKITGKKELQNNRMKNYKNSNAESIKKARLKIALNILNY